MGRGALNPNLGPSDQVSCNMGGGGSLVAPTLTCGVGISQCLCSVTVNGACNAGWTMFRGHGQSQPGDRSQKRLSRTKPDIPERSKYKKQGLSLDSQH